MFTEQTLTMIFAGLAAVFTGWLACTAYIELKHIREQMELEAFKSILKEMSDPEVRMDRGIVKENIKRNTKATTIKRYIDRVRSMRNENDLEKNKNDNRLRIGQAIERTIVSLDRIGFIVIGDSNKIKTKPPKWVWMMAREYWERLGEWVIYRQETEGSSHGIYFQKLAEEAQKKTK
jgi:hypothetical protein